MAYQATSYRAPIAINIIEPNSHARVTTDSHRSSTDRRRALHCKTSAPMETIKIAPVPKCDTALARPTDVTKIGRTSSNRVTNHVNPHMIRTLQAMLAKMNVRTESRVTGGVLCSLFFNSA